jgi:hypothetical protein
MRSASIVFVLLFASGGFVHAQAGSTHPLFVMPPASVSCPVNLSATREPGGPLHAVAKDSVPTGQQLRINFDGATSLVIVKADIVVHGVATSHSEGMILSGPLGVSRKSSESFQLAGTPSAPLVHPLLSAKDMTAVSWLELTRLEYADGKVWQASEGSRCIAAPSLYLLVDSAN